MGWFDDIFFAFLLKEKMHPSQNNQRSRNSQFMRETQEMMRWGIFSESSYRKCMNGLIISAILTAFLGTILCIIGYGVMTEYPFEETTKPWDKDPSREEIKIINEKAAHNNKVLILHIIGPVIISCPFYCLFLMLACWSRQRKIRFFNWAFTPNDDSSMSVFPEGRGSQYDGQYEHLLSDADAARGPPPAYEGLEPSAPSDQEKKEQ